MEVGAANPSWLSAQTAGMATGAGDKRASVTPPVSAPSGAAETSGGSSGSAPGGMNPTLYAALYGPLPGTSGGGGGALAGGAGGMSAGSGGGNGVTASIEAEANNLKNENDIMEERLRQLSASIHGMASASGIPGGGSKSSQHGGRGSLKKASRDSSGLRESRNSGFGNNR